MKHFIILTLLTILLSSNVNYAHDGAGNATHLKKWTFKNEQKIKASFLFLASIEISCWSNLKPFPSCNLRINSIW